MRWSSRSADRRRLRAQTSAPIAPRSNVRRRAPRAQPRAATDSLQAQSLWTQGQDASHAPDAARFRAARCAAHDSARRRGRRAHLRELRRRPSRRSTLAGTPPREGSEYFCARAPSRASAQARDPINGCACHRGRTESRAPYPMTRRPARRSVLGVRIRSILDHRSVRLAARLQRIEVDRRQQELRKTTLCHELRHGGARVRKQHARTDAANRTIELDIGEVTHHEHARLLDLNKKNGGLVMLCGNGNGEHYFAQLRRELVNEGVQVKTDLGIPCALDTRSVWCLIRAVLQIHAL